MGGHEGDKKWRNRKVNEGKGRRVDMKERLREKDERIQVDRRRTEARREQGRNWEREG